MPSLFRFLVFLGILSGLTYGAIFSLARFVEPKTAGDHCHPFRNDKFYKNR